MKLNISLLPLRTTPEFMLLQTEKWRWSNIRRRCFPWKFSCVRPRASHHAWEVVSCVSVAAASVSARLVLSETVTFWPRTITMNLEGFCFEVLTSVFFCVKTASQTPSVWCLFAKPGKFQCVQFWAKTWSGIMNEMQTHFRRFLCTICPRNPFISETQAVIFSLKDQQQKFATRRPIDRNCSPQSELSFATKWFTHPTRKMSTYPKKTGRNNFMLKREGIGILISVRPNEISQEPRLSTSVYPAEVPDSKTSFFGHGSF